VSPYFFAYMAAGVCVLFAFLIDGRRVHGEWLSLKTELASGCPFAPGSRKYWWEVNFLGTVGPPILVVLGVFAWPALVVAKVYDILAGRSRQKQEVFTVGRRDLIRQMTVQEIESVERVVDPMGAVPPVPFGFLNPVWQRFIAGIHPSDTIWSFSAHRMYGWRNECRVGYVLKSGRRVGAHFLTSIHELPGK
jgi:hypothetical protein